MADDMTARIARALWDHDNAHMPPEWRDMAWDDMGGSEPCAERGEYELRATALAPILAERDREVARKAVKEHEARQTHITYERPMVREVPVRMPCPRCGAR